MPGPVFVVGASRSGTALLRSALNRHPEVYLAGETHWFDGPRTRLSTLDAPLQGAERADVVRHFRALSHRPFGHAGTAESGWLSADRLTAAAARLGGRADAFFEAFCRLEAEDAGAGDVTRWGEKTPRHVYRIDEMLTAFPASQVICMIRDPRAVVASYRDWRNQGGFDLDADPGHAAALARERERTRASYHPVLATGLWRATVRRTAAARSSHGSSVVRAMRYEDLVSSPEATLRDLCAWLELDYAPSMLDVPVHNSSFAAFDEAGGFREQAMSRWRTTLTEDEVATVQTVAGSTLGACGYGRMAVSSQVVRSLPSIAGAPAAAVRAYMANRDRLGDPVAYVTRRVRSLL